MILKSTLIVFTGNIFAHLINYLYHFVAGYFLSPDQFGLLQSFVSLNYFLAVIVSSFSLSIIHQLNKTPTSKKTALIANLQNLSLKLTLIIWLACLLLFPVIKTLLRFDNPYLLIIFSIQILFSFVPTLYLSLIQANLKFTQFSLINLLSPLTKTLSALILFLLGFKIFGALIGLSLAGLVPAIYSFLLVKKHFPSHRLVGLWPNLTPLTGSDPVTPLPKSFFKFGLAAFIVNLSLTSLYNSDLLLVRFYFSNEQSGIYAAASILSKIIFFVSATVLTVAFPVFTLHANNLKKLKTNFTQSLFLITTIAFLGLTFYQTYPHLVIKLFSNPAYAKSSTLLSGFSLFFFFFTILNLLIQLLLTINKRWTIVVSLLSAILQLTLIFFFHQNLTQIISNSIIATLTGLTLSLGVTIKKLYVKA
ncbi:MAG: oligosaccharide flippase family protein [Candidatus Beckwithbacteria bacterium]|nr:oligosaccharide flippase family protein [Patescibacteria group bacterium]